MNTSSGTGNIPVNESEFQSGYSDVNGLKMYYEIHGSKGDYLVLIHGGGSMISTTFGMILPMLSGDFRVIAVELQAHGRTSDRDSSESFERDADDVAMLLRNLDIRRAAIFGFSNGGNTAIQIALRNPDIISKLILASTFYKREGLIPGFFNGLEHATIDNMPQPLKDAFLKVTPDETRLLTMFTKDKERMLRFRDWTDEQISSINHPTLIICADRDVIQVSHALEMANRIKDSRLLILPANHGSYIGASEGGSNDTRMPEMVVEIVKGFLLQR